MTIAAQIQHIALEFASNAQHRAFALQSKLAEISVSDVAAAVSKADRGDVLLCVRSKPPGEKPRPRALRAKPR